MIKVVFFASLREVVGQGEMHIEASQPMRLSELNEQVRRSLPSEAQSAVFAENVRIAVNQTLVAEDLELQSGDEVAFLPPVTGG